MVRILAASLAAGFVAFPVLADEQEDDGPDYARTGFYFGFGVAGASFFDLERRLEGEAGAGFDLDTAIGFDVLVGYRAVPNAAFEAEFSMLPNTEIKTTGGGKVAELDTWKVSYNAKFFLMTGQVQPYGVMGFGYMRAELEDFGIQGVGSGVRPGTSKEFAGTIGAGTDFYITDSVALNADVRYQYTTGSLEDYDAIEFGAGLIYRF
jgi:opacity protein-like surface antigen